MKKNLEKKTKKCISFISKCGGSKSLRVTGLNQRLWSPKKLVFGIFEEFNSKKSLGVLGIQFSVMAENETWSKCFLIFLKVY